MVLLSPQGPLHENIIFSSLNQDCNTVILEFLPNHLQRFQSLIPRITSGVLCAVLLAAVACSPSPQAREQRYLRSAKSYEDKGKLREAAIQYLNAIQLDARSAEA